MRTVKYCLRVLLYFTLVAVSSFSTRADNTEEEECLLELQTALPKSLTFYSYVIPNAPYSQYRTHLASSSIERQILRTNSGKLFISPSQVLYSNGDSSFSPAMMLCMGGLVLGATLGGDDWGKRVSYGLLGFGVGAALYLFIYGSSS